MCKAVKHSTTCLNHSESRKTNLNVQKTAYKMMAFGLVREWLVLCNYLRHQYSGCKNPAWRCGGRASTGSSFLGRAIKHSTDDHPYLIGTHMDDDV